MHHRIVAGTAVTVGTLSIAAALAMSSAVSSATAGAGTPVAASRTIAVVRTLSASLPPYPLRCVVTATNVNYRRGPGMQYASYGQLGRGFAFASDGGVPNPRSRYQYWNNIERPGHADAYVDAAYVYCWLG